MDPPKDPRVEMICLKDHGTVMFSIGAVTLEKSSVHLLLREEAEPFVISGVLKQLE